MPSSLRALVLALTISMAPAVCAGAAAPTANLLKNPGFEAGLKGHSWMPAGWDTVNSGLSTVFFGRDTFLVHGGNYAVSVANLSTTIPVWHNWSQTLVVGPEVWGKDLVFSVWTRSVGVQGRAYVLLQAYRDTVEKMARTWKVPRDSALTRMRILAGDAPYFSLGWKREFFSDVETDWVKREVRVFVPPSTNILIVRCGIFGTGQVMFDDASLTIHPARPSPPLALKTNLLADPGFEGNGNEWEYSMPPYEGLVVEKDSTVAHGGKYSIRMEGGLAGVMSTRAGVCQAISNRTLSGKRLRLSGYVKTDSLMGQAYIKLYSSTLNGDIQEPSPRVFNFTNDWTQTVMEVDTPPGTYVVWVWFLFNTPATGKVYYDDCSLEVLGTAEYVKKGTSPPKGQTR